LGSSYPKKDQKGFISPIGFEASIWIDTGVCCENEKRKKRMKIHVSDASLIVWFVSFLLNIAQ